MMKRRAFKVLLFVLAGAIMNVAVAWGFAIYSPFWPNKGWHIKNEWRESVSEWWDSEYPFAVKVNVKSTSVTKSKYGPMSFVSTKGIELAHLSSDTWQSEPPNCSAWRMISGIPMRSMTGSRWRLFERNEPEFANRGGVFIQFMGRARARGEIDWLMEGGRVLPLRPIWPGFAINTIFYAAIVWFLFFMPGAIRKLTGGVRRKRGQCAACGYSLRDNVSNTCPECGAVK
jgi:hypothetical protein